MVVEPTQDPFESDEESVEEGGDSSLWRRVVQQYSSLADVSFSQFVSLDEDVTTENQMTENDAEREALEAVQPVAHASSQGSDSDDDISVIEPTPLGLTPVQATEAVKGIRDFIITLDDSGERERIPFPFFSDGGCVLKIENNEHTNTNYYSRNFKCLSFVLFPFYDSYHRLCCVTLITSNALQIV